MSIPIPQTSPAISAGGIPPLQLVRTRTGRVLVGLALVAIVAVPTNIASAYWLSVLNAVGIAAIAAVGLNVLTGYAGQLSLGHAFFASIGAFTAQYVGGVHGLPMVVWLPCAGIAAGLIGGLVAPFALRLRGPYLAIVSLSLVFIGIYAARNLPEITGGHNGTVVTAQVKIGPVDFERLQVGPLLFSREQGLAILIWTVLAVVLLLVANVMRTRGGRAMQATRDHDIAAEVLGVRMLRAQVNAFVLASGIGGIAGGLLAVNLQYVRPENFDVALSVQYLAIIVIGGLGTLIGPILGALFVGLVPVFVDKFAESLPFMSEAGGTGLSTTDLTLILYGSLIAVFLILEPRGLIHIGRRVVARIARRPITAAPGGN